jgi:hypothetical protein
LQKQKSRGVSEEVPTAFIFSIHALLAVDKPFPHVVPPPPVSHAVELVQHLLNTDPFSKSGFFLPDLEQLVKRNLQKEATRPQGG